MTPVLMLGLVEAGVGLVPAWGGCTALLARYAAADVSPPAQRGRAMGLIVWGSTVGSIIGPNLMAPALSLGALLAVPATASAFLISVAGYGIAALLTFCFLRPDPLAIARQAQATADAGRPAGVARTLGAILADVRVQIALATLSVSQFVMISTTSTSPLYLHDQGHTVGTIGIAVSLHLAGMYVASPLSGWLADRFGRLPVIAAGALMLIFAVGLAGIAPGTEAVPVILGLFLNGVGWNLAFVAGSALLSLCIGLTQIEARARRAGQAPAATLAGGLAELQATGYRRLLDIAAGARYPKRPSLTYLAPAYTWLQFSRRRMSRAALLVSLYRNYVRFRRARGWLPDAITGGEPFDLQAVLRVRMDTEAPAIAEPSTGLTMGQSAEKMAKENGISRQEQDEIARAALERVGLGNRLDHKPSELSIGQQQRVALARTLANSPSIILADEPTGNLDPATADSVAGMLKELNEDGITIVMVTHDPRMAARAGSVMQLVDGAIRAQ